MSIENAFDNLSEEILKPWDIVKKIEYFPETVIVTFDETISEIVKNQPDAKIIGEFNAGYKIPIYEITQKDKRIGVYKTLIGSAGTVMLLEEAIAKGAKKFIFFGSCGTLVKDISVGKFIVPTAAYRDEGTSYHYIPAGDYIEVKTAEKLSEIMTKLNLPHIKGKTWTTDAIYRETKNNMAKRKSEGCITVDMECSAVMAAGELRGVEVYQYLYAEDNLDSDEWERRSMGTVPINSKEKYLLIALDIAVMV